MLGGSGLVGGAFTALWHGAAAYGLTGVAAAARPQPQQQPPGDLTWYRIRT